MIDKVFPILSEVLKTRYRAQFNEALSKVTNSLRSICLFSVEKSVPEKYLTMILTQRFWSLCLKTFVYEMHVYREQMGLPFEVKSSDAFDSFLKAFSIETIQEWFGKYPILDSMVTASMDSVLAFSVELFSNLQKDSKDLVDSGLISAGSQIDDVCLLGSDWHNGSRCVVAFSENLTPTVVYKPKSLAVDLWFDKLFHIISREEDEFPSPVPLTLNRETYGWQRFIAPRPMMDSLLGESFRKLGFVSALLTATGASDIHDENLVFLDGQPLLIDLETAMQSRSVQFTPDLSGCLLKTLFRSICSTSIIPAKMVTAPRRLLIGAINTPYPQQTSESMFVLRNAGTDGMDIARENVAFARLAEPLSLLSGESVNPVPYQQNFVDGYRLGYRRIISHREELLEALNGINFPIRRVLRPTAKYARLLDALLFPENLVSSDAASQITQYLKPLVNQFLSVDASKILEREISALECGDIPYFYTFADECCVRSNGFSIHCKDGVSPSENAKNTFVNMSEDNLLQNERFIAEGFSEIRISMSRYLNSEVKSLGVPMFNQCLNSDNTSLVSSLFSLFSRLAIESDSAVGWLPGLYGDMPLSYHSESLISFHDAAGISLPLTRFAKTFVSNTFAASLRDRALNGIRQLSDTYYATIAANERSIISGPSSIDYVLNHDKQRLSFTEGDVNKLGECESVGDVFNGLAGQYLLLASLADVNPRTLTANYMHMRNIVEKKHELSGGIAHGDLGLIWALLRVSKRLDDQLGQSIALEKLNRIDLASLDLRIGYCNGGAGLLLVKSEAVKFSNCMSRRELHSIARQITDLSVLRGPIDLSVCHGASGVVQSLLQSYFDTGDSYFKDLAIDYWSKVLGYAREFGYYTGEPQRDYLLGYFLGWAGIFDTSLLVYSPETWRWTPIALCSSESSRPARCVKQ